MVKNWKKILFFVLPAILYAGIIFYMSSLSKPPVPQLSIKLEDKLFHFMAYTLLGMLILRALQFGRRTPIGPGILFLGICLGCLYGVSDEIHQYFVPGRYAEMLDWIADAVGVLAGTIFYAKFYKIELELLIRTRQTVARNEKIQ